MFRRTLELNIAKSPKSKPAIDGQNNEVPVDYAQIVRETTETIVKGAVVMVGSFVILDTIRQTVVKITPQH